MSVTEKFLSMEYGPAPEDPREALVWLDRHSRKLGHFIGGAFRPPAESVYFDTVDPSTGEPLAFALSAMNSTMMPYIFWPPATAFRTAPLPRSATAAFLASVS